jgi:hypothetical protein
VVGTNNIESYWAVLKRPIYGTYHKVSEKYLQKYIDESAFRFNTRHMSSGERFSYGSQLIIPSIA